MAEYAGIDIIINASSDKISILFRLFMFFMLHTLSQLKNQCQAKSVISLNVLVKNTLLQNLLTTLIREIISVRKINVKKKVLYHSINYSFSSNDTLKEITQITQ